MLCSLLNTAFLLYTFMSLPVWQVVWQSEEGGAAGLGVELFSGAAQVPEPQCEQTAPPAGRRLHLPAPQSPLPVSLLLPGPTQPLSMCPGTRGFINGEWRKVLTLVLVKKSGKWMIRSSMRRWAGSGRALWSWTSCGCPSVWGSAGSSAPPRHHSNRASGRDTTSRQSRSCGWASCRLGDPKEI